MLLFLVFFFGWVMPGGLYDNKNYHELHQSLGSWLLWRKMRTCGGSRRSTTINLGDHPTRRNPGRRLGPYHGLLATFSVGRI
ncbi:hypothetical protein F4861DRAFT_507670 [Xylaria intraflava]|nr:hypothetical protein F4861DRAFT_507670 [Xylaria intraflava]